MEIAYATVARAGRPIREAFEAAQRAGMHWLDLWMSDAGNFDAASWRSVSDAIRTHMDEFDTRVIGLGASLGGPLHAGGRALRALTWRHFLNLLAAAEACGAPVVRIRSAAAPERLPWPEALFRTQRLLAPMVEAGQEAGIAVCLEPAAASPFEFPSRFLALAEVCPGLKLTYDTGMFVATGVPLLMTESLFGHTAHVRLRDAASGRRTVPWGLGGVDAAWLLARLLHHGYSGAVSVEHVAGRDLTDPFADVVRMLRELDWLLQRVPAW